MRLRVGYAPSLASGILPVAVENFTQAHPGARVELFEVTIESTIARTETLVHRRRLSHGSSG